ncbi:hypothetical protein K3556_09395 [Aliiroseovarius sp. M344]|uniref:hypothetical protein n=1 Tax=Aliiroseovarius sp. M344 TaxID=2867010 RepID=UPI0021ADF2C2|nr:hypothetical protein [Aliiroseovarius sp. M344]UWQ13183.1 hypothetical protein K3556_09395 [Aliiroseovarius sp. M344]
MNLILAVIGAAGLYGGSIIAALAETDKYACSRIINAPPIENLFLDNDGANFWQIASDRLGQSLLGVQCTSEQISSYFERAGCELSGESIGYSVNGPASKQFERDQVIAFCRPRKLPGRLFFYRCDATVGISMFKGRITHISAGANK